MKYTYSETITPPGLLIPVVISDLISRALKKLQREIDTGGGITTIPESLVGELSLEPFDFAQASGAFDGYRTIPTYYITITLETGKKFDIQVISSKRNFMLLGRDILNRMISQHSLGRAPSFSHLTRAGP